MNSANINNPDRHAADAHAMDLQEETLCRFGESSV